MRLSNRIHEFTPRLIFSTLVFAILIAQFGVARGQAKYDVKDVKNRLFINCGSDGNFVCKWNGETYDDVTFSDSTDNWGVWSIAFDPTKEELKVLGNKSYITNSITLDGLDANQCRLQDKRSRMGAWNISSITYDRKGNLYCVGEGGHVAKWSGLKWDKVGDKTVHCIAFNGDNTMSVVGKNGDLGYLDKASGRFTGWRYPGGWNLKYIAYDITKKHPKGVLWCVGRDGQTAYWEGETGAWNDQGKNDKGAYQIAFRPEPSVAEPVEAVVITNAQGSVFNKIPLNRITAIKVVKSNKDSVKLTQTDTTEIRLTDTKTSSTEEEISFEEWLETTVTASATAKDPVTGSSGTASASLTAGFSAAQKTKITEALASVRTKMKTSTMSREQTFNPPMLGEYEVCFQTEELIAYSRPMSQELTIGTLKLKMETAQIFTEPRFSKVYRIGSTELNKQWEDYKKQGFERLLLKKDFEQFIDEKNFVEKEE